MPADRHKTLEERTRYEPADVEPRVFARWQDARTFHPDPEGSAQENYSIAVPPPNVTGSPHMGHALNGSIQDVLIRVARMLKRARWIYGTDHAGIAVQRQVEKALEAEGTTREELGRAAFIERVWEWRREHGSTITEQSARPGVARLRGRALHDGRRLPARRRARVRAPVREGARLPRQLPGQLGPRSRDGDLRPRGRAAHGRGHALLDRSPA